MDDIVYPDAAPEPTPFSLTLGKINSKTEQLKTTGLTRKDHEKLRERLKFPWGEARDGGTTTTTWRWKRARTTYQEIQDKSCHLFLAVILVINPTECHKPLMAEVLDFLLSLESYQAYGFNLTFVEKPFFELVAAEQGFMDTRRYRSFMSSIFPQEDRRLYQLAYSEIPLENIDRFFEMLREGIETGRGWQEERRRGDTVANFVVGLVPTGDNDICFQITVGRMAGMDSLGECKLGRINLS